MYGRLLAVIVCPCTAGHDSVLHSVHKRCQGDSRLEDMTSSRAVMEAASGIAPDMQRIPGQFQDSFGIVGAAM